MDLPATGAGRPGRPAGRSPLQRGHGLEVGLEVAGHLRDRVAAELLEERVGEHERDHRLGDRGRGRDRADVGALVVRLCGLAGGDIEVARARGTVEIGFMAARTRITSPLDAPTSVHRAVGAPHG